MDPTPENGSEPLPTSKRGSGVGERSRSNWAYPRPRRDFRRPRAGAAELTPKTICPDRYPEARGSANARGAIGAYPRPRRDFRRPRAGAAELTPKDLCPSVDRRLEGRRTLAEHGAYPRPRRDFCRPRAGESKSPALAWANRANRANPGMTAGFGGFPEKSQRAGGSESITPDDHAEFPVRGSPGRPASAG